MSVTRVLLERTMAVVYLKGRHGHNDDGDHTLPISQQAIFLVFCHSGQCDNGCIQ